MRILYVKLVGYIGLYNGIGKSELAINFANSKNNITVISGANGCGKSTLLNALNILPDTNDNFIPNIGASKELKIAHEDTLYEIFINHPVDGKGNRSTTKVSIKKNGMELNPNGNVSSYKEIIFDEFELDGNFITLSHLSGDDRGLADKKPAERKKFIANISTSLDTYNAIHKNLNKKANVYKSYINNLSGKIQSIGDETNLQNTKISLANRRSRLDKEIDDLKAEVIESKTLISVSDPNGSLQQKYEEADKDCKELKLQSNKAFSFLRSYYESHYKPEDLELTLDAIGKRKEDIDTSTAEYSNKIESNNNAIKIHMTTMENNKATIARNKIRIDKLKQEINPELESQLVETKNKIGIIEDAFHEVGITDIDNISSSEINQVIVLLQNFIESIDRIYELIPADSLAEFCDITLNSTIGNEVDKCNKIISNTKDSLNNTCIRLTELQNDYDILSDLDHRPDKCKIDHCYFLSKPMEVLKKYDSKEDLEALIKNIKSTIEDMRLTIRINEEMVQKLKSYSSSESILGTITTQVNANETILKKISMFIRLLDKNALYELISNGNRFNEYRDLTMLRNIANYITEYKSLTRIYDKLLNEKQTNNHNIQALAEYESEMEMSQSAYDAQLKEINKLTEENKFLNGLLSTLANQKKMIDELSNRYNQWVEVDNKYQKRSDDFEKISQQSKGLSVVLNKMGDLVQQIQTKENERKPIEDQEKNIDSQLMILQSYHQEYAMYQERYDIVNKLKKYSSPTAGGIQTLFMQLYMSKTLELANQLLGMIFQGQYQLLDYVINADEFRMPFIGNGLAVDDISSGSTSQVCIMGMIINLVLLNQASTKYNITRLDEIDGGLDHANRYMFVDILQRIIQILHIEQLFIISHSAESALSNVDVIQLAPIPDYEDVFSGANIIYSYSWEQ